jgi:uracil phosphoribosyltransferase
MQNDPFIMNHPLLQHKLSILRDKHTGSKQFRELISEISMLMCYEATRDLPLKQINVQTPVGVAKCNVLSGRKLAIVSILRAGEGMITGMLNLVPAAKVGHIGLYRDPDTLKPQEYYCKLPSDIHEREVIVVDPMLATGGSAIDSITRIKEKGAKNIRFMCIVAAPEGLKALRETHPDVKIYCGSLDQRLNSHGYIVPGLGDAGDRIFGTK